MATTAELEGNVRSLLVQSLSPTALSRLDAMIAYLEADSPLDQGYPGDSFGMEDIRQFLAENLDETQMRMLDQLISELDHGYPDEDADAREDYTEAAQQQEENSMLAHDEMRLLRSQLRAANVPVGDVPDLEALRHLSRHHPNMRRRGMAQDSVRDRSLSLGRMFPSIAARFAKSGPSSLTVSGASADSAARQRAASHRMAFDSRSPADDRLSIRSMFPSIAARLKI